MARFEENGNTPTSTSWTHNFTSPVGFNNFQVWIIVLSELSFPSIICKVQTFRKIAMLVVCANPD